MSSVIGLFGEGDLARKRAIGLAVVLGTIVLVFLAYTQPNPFAAPMRVAAIFDDASGVGRVGGEVRMAGVPVGQIGEIRRVGDDALVTLELDDDAGVIHSDASAALRPRIAFEGTAFVDLDPGSDSAPALGDHAIGRSATRSYVALDQALRFARPDTRRDLARDLSDLERLSGRPAQAGLQQTLRESPALTEQLDRVARAALGPSGDELAGTVRGLAGTTRAAAAREDDLGPLVTSAARTLAALNTANDVPLDALVAELPDRLNRLDSGGGSLEGTVDRLEPLAEDLRPGLRDLGPTLRDARPLIARARQALEGAPGLVDDLQGAVESGADSAPAASNLLDALQPSLDLLDRSLLPTLEKPTKLGMPTYEQFMTLFQGGGGASRPFQGPADGGGVPEVQGDGHFMRFGARFYTGLGAPAPPCALLAEVNAELAAQLSTQGLCTP